MIKLEQDWMKKDVEKEHKTIDVPQSMQSSIVLSIKAAGVCIGLGYLWMLWGIALSGYREIPFTYKAMGNLIFCLSQLILSDDYMAGGWSGPRFLFALIINAIPWSILVFILHRTYCRYLKFRMEKSVKQ